jgi:hypothetical protein
LITFPGNGVSRGPAANSLADFRGADHESPFRRAHRAVLLFLPFASQLAAEDVQLNAVFVCNGERIIVESCNIRDLSDSASCMVGHPDNIKPNGLMAYTNETRGALKKLLPTCKQPTAEQIARANNFQRPQAEQLAANTKKANDELDASEAKVQSSITGKPALSPEERAANRCVASGRNPSLCMGNQLDNFFGSAVNMVLPGMVKPVLFGEASILITARLFFMSMAN